jgi:hypothetical protein
VSGYAGKDEFDITTCAQFQNNSQASRIVKKVTMTDFYQIRLTHNQHISNTAFLVVKRLWVCRIMLVTVLFIKQSHWQRLNVSMGITAANK